MFFADPRPFHAHSDPAVLAQALGATLYVPAIRDDLAGTIRRRARGGVRSMVIDLEDSVPDERVEEGLVLARDALADLHADPPEALLFVRVRTPEMVVTLLEKLDATAGVLTGLVLPKFSYQRGEQYLDAMVRTADDARPPLLIMPVLETPEVLYAETRAAELQAIRTLLARHRDRVLAVRIGATDLCGLYGIRRDRDLTVYDVGIAALFIADVVNHLGRSDGTGYPITGPVWEYFAGHERMFRPQLRQTPFEDRDAERLRADLLLRDMDGLLREIVLDRVNGLTGKTVIHPSHVDVVHALSVVPHEEFVDAQDVLGAVSGGARSSEFRNKMNESRPHRVWAQRIALRAEVFGVSRPSISHVDILSALWTQP
nr:HpcH/HpaI aldolase/citrate lyase family protein [Nakamurella flavida]